MNKVIVEYSPEWVKKYEDESVLIQRALGEVVHDIQHIGSTSISGIKAKPIIDIAVLLNSYTDADSLIEPLSELRYVYDELNSSNERHLFRKGSPIEFHLSLAYKDRGSFWERQILFRDYLRSHPEKVHEYEVLKESLLKADPTGNETYISGKSDFVNAVLDLARGQ